MDGAWEMRRADSDDNWITGDVPGCVHTDLLAHGLIPEPFVGSNEESLQWIERCSWDYRRDFVADEALLSSEHVELVFEGVDTDCEIMLNGEVIGSGANMFASYRMDVRDRLRNGDNRIAVRLKSPMAYIEAHRDPSYPREWNDKVGGCAFIRKQQCSFGWDWGPRFAMSGIWRPVRLEVWKGDRIERVHVSQTHSKDGVALQVRVETAMGNVSPDVELVVSLRGREVARTRGSDIRLDDPELWWPNGFGDAVLYDLNVSLLLDGEWIDTRSMRVGLRTIELERKPDQWGESFCFVVNGRPVFAKGANWIPAHSFPHVVSKSDYRSLLESCVESHMNMIRVWGGGIYEMPEFYDLCDELGLMVWQDFMFACAVYPGTPEMLDGIDRELETQIPRLQHHACLALWCGNNEIELYLQHNGNDRLRAEYMEIFEERLARRVDELDGTRPYWRSSPTKPEGYLNLNICPNGPMGDIPDAGDTHDWTVWHGLAAPEYFQNTYYRFISEFGMQSYPSYEVARQFIPEGRINVFGKDFETHQKHEGGNSKIFHYLSQRYPFPKDYRSLAYLSQLTQAWAIRTGVEHWRSHMPRCMGVIYWQLNDCWPVSSWSSIDFGGQWKALQYQMKRSFSPVLVTARAEGTTRVGVGNEHINTISGYHLRVINDSLADITGVCEWQVFDVDGALLDSGGQEMMLPQNTGVAAGMVDLTKALELASRFGMVVRVGFRSGDEILGENAFTPCPPRLMTASAHPLLWRWINRDAGKWEIEVVSRGYHHGVYLFADNAILHPSDNYFDLFPGTPKRIAIRLRSEPVLAADELALRVWSVWDAAM